MRPFPITFMLLRWRSRSWRSMETNSPTLMPVAYSNSRIARSLAPNGVSGNGSSRSSWISPLVRKDGVFSAVRGVAAGRAGFVLQSPRTCRYLKKLRTAESFRPIVCLLKPEAARRLIKALTERKSTSAGFMLLAERSK